jgi:hypothetical protein
MTENIIEISFSGTQNSGQLDVAGSPKALRYVSESIFNLVHDKDRIICVVKAAIFDPTPYDIYLKYLSICKSNTLIKCSVFDNCLYIQGSNDKLTVLANWFYFDDDTPSGYHQHVDYYDENEWIEPVSIPLVISVKDSIV